MKPPPDDLLELVRITTAVNRVANDGPEVQEPWRAGSEPPPPAAKAQAKAKPEQDKPPREKPAPRRKAAGDDGGQGSLF